MMHKVKHVHFVGIGGAGMSGIAEVLLKEGYQVSGSDLAETAVTKRLREQGARVQVGHDPKHVRGANVVVISTAIKHDNPEIAAARKAHIPVIPRALMLAELMRLKKIGIAVAGTHGKTTTTSLIASVLAEAGEDPTFVIGGRLNSAGSHARLGASDFLVVEADESDASFLHLQPAIAVVTNIDVDHMETYGHSLSRLKATFIDFLERLPFYGAAVVCADDPGVRDIIPLVSKRVITYGMTGEPDIRAHAAEHSGGMMRFKVTRARRMLRRSQQTELEVTLNLPGLHNVLNACAAIGVALELGLDDEPLLRSLEVFQGVARRLQRFGDVRLRDGCTVTLVDDYGHHPAEMRVTLEALRGAYPNRRLVLAFQPHRYTRTRDLFDSFIDVLSGVDALVLADIYPAGESPITGADGKSLYRAIKGRARANSIFVSEVTGLAEALRRVARDGDVIVTMGAGSIGGVAGALARKSIKGRRTKDEGRRMKDEG